MPGQPVCKILSDNPRIRQTNGCKIPALSLKLLLREFGNKRSYCSKRSRKRSLVAF